MGLNACNNLVVSVCYTLKHAEERAQERYGLILDKILKREILHKIRHFGYLRSRRETWTRTIFWLHIRGQFIKVVYSKTRKDIVTFLPLNGGQL